MAVRVFSGADALAVLPGGLVGLDAGPATWAVLFKRNQTSFTTLWSSRDAASVTSATFGQAYNFGVIATAANTVRFGTGVGLGGADSDGTATTAIVNADGWVLLAATKAAGTVAGRIHRYVLGTSTMTRENATPAVADGNAITSAYRFVFGKDEFNNKLTGKIAAAGWWPFEMSDSQVDELNTNRNTAAWFTNTGGLPTAIWEFNQPVVSIPLVDLTGGGANETGILRTTVDLADDPPSWQFLSTYQTAEQPRRMPLGV